MSFLFSRPRLVLSFLAAGFVLALSSGCVVAVRDHPHHEPPPPPPPEVRADVIIR